MEPLAGAREQRATLGRRFIAHGYDKVIAPAYDILDRQVAVLMNERKLPGRYEVSFNGSKLATGVYLYRLTAGNFIETRKMIVLR